MIVLENKDRRIWILEDRIIDIIHCATSTVGNIELSLNCEGPCLSSCGFYHVLDEICNRFDIDKKKLKKVL